MSLNRQPIRVVLLLSALIFSFRPVLSIADNSIRLAITNGDLAKVKIYLSLPDQSPGGNGKNEPLLHWAIIEKQREIINYLLAKKVDVNRADEEGRTPLILAITTGEKDIVDLILKNGADINLRGIGHRGKIQTLIPVGISMSMSYDKNRRGFNMPITRKVPAPKRTPLYEAIDQGKIGIASMLLEAGADVKGEGEYLLNLAVNKTFKKEDPDFILALQQKGAALSANKLACLKALKYGIKYQMYNLIDQSLTQLSASKEYQEGRVSILWIVFKIWHLELDRKMVASFVQHGLLHPGKETNSPQQPSVSHPSGIGKNNRPGENQSPYTYAIQSGLVKSVRALLENNIEPSPESLQQAIGLKKFDIAELLLEQGFDINSIDRGLGNYVSTNRKHGSIENVKINDTIIDFLIKKNIDVNKTYRNQYPLEIAVYRGESQLVRLLLKKDAKPRPAETKAIDIMTAVAARKDKELVELLLAKNYPVNGDDQKSNKKSPLCAAISSLETVSVLLAAGADVGHPCVKRSFRSADFKAMEMLLDAGFRGDQQIVISFIRNKNASNIHIIERLLQSVPGDEAEQYRQTFLKYACQVGKNGVVKLLFQQGADLSAGDDRGETPLMYAARAGHVHLISWLLDNGAQIHARSKYGMTAITAAVHRGDLATVKLLVERGADVNETEPLGLDLYTLARMRNQSDIAEYLLSFGASSDTYDSLIAEKESFLENQAEFFAGIDAGMSLDDYLQLKMMLKQTAGIEEPAHWQPNPEFSTPEKTWIYYKRMLLNGKNEKALACHLPGSAEEFRKIYQSIGTEMTSEMVKAMQEIEKVEQNQSTAKYRIRKKMMYKGSMETITFYI